MTDPSGPLRIEETTVATLSGWRVTVGNIIQHTAEVGLYDEDKAPRGERTVAVGDELTIAGRRFAVARIEPGAGAENGFLELTALPS